MRRIFSILMTFLSVAFCSAQSNITDTYWRNDKTGEWIAGFIGNSMVYDCKTWDIASMRQRKDSYTIVAKNANEEITVSVGKEKNGQRTIFFGKDKAICSQIKSKLLPDYPQKDTTTALADNNYREGDSVTIAGWMKNMPEKMLKLNPNFTITAYNFFTDKEETYSSPLDSLGRFSLRIPLLNSKYLFCDWRRTNIQLYAEPNETYFLMMDFTNQQAFVMGKNARLQNELLAHEIDLYFPSVHEEMPKRGAMGYLELCDSVMKAKTKQIDDIYQSCPNLSERYRSFYRNSLTVKMGRELMQGKFRVRNLPDEYLDYVTKNVWNKLEEPYTLTDHCFATLANDYSSYMQEKWMSEHAKEPTTGERILMAEEEGIITLTEHERSCVKEYDSLLATLYKALETADKATSKTLINEFKSNENVVVLNRVFNQEGIQEFLKKHAATENLKYFSRLDSMGWNKRMCDILASRKLCNDINQTREPLPVAMVEHAKSYIQLPSALNMALALNNHYIEISKTANEMLEKVLKSSDIVKGMTDGQEIFQKLIEPYRGKLVIVDIWGTWCSPCKEALSHSQEEFARLKPYDVAYLYLANRSADAGWKNVIQEYNITGENVAHYNLPAEQQTAVEWYLKVRKFPTYVLIGKDGNIIDYDVEARDLDNFELTIKKILDR